MPDSRRSALIADDPLVAQIIEGPVYWLEDRLPDLVIEASWDTGGVIDFSQASQVKLLISRFRQPTNQVILYGTVTNVAPGRGQYRFVYPTTDAASTLAGGVDNSSNPVDVVIQAGAGAAFPAPATAGPFLITIDNEILKCTARVTDTLTCSRAQEGTTIAAHSGGAAVALQFNPFVTPARYIAQAIATFSGKTQRSQRFLITVIEGVA